MRLEHCLYGLFISLDFFGLFNHRKTFRFRFPILALLTNTIKSYKLEFIREMKIISHKKINISIFRYMKISKYRDTINRRPVLPCRRCAVDFG